MVVFSICLWGGAVVKSLMGWVFYLYFCSSWDAHHRVLSLQRKSLYDKKLFWCDVFGTIWASSIAARQTTREALIWSVRGYKYRKSFNLQQMKTFSSTLKSLWRGNQSKILEEKNIQVARGCFLLQMNEKTKLQSVLYSFYPTLYESLRYYLKDKAAHYL